MFLGYAWKKRQRTNEQHESCGKTGDGAHTRVAATAAAPSGTVPETSRNAPHPLLRPTPAAHHDHNHSPWLNQPVTTLQWHIALWIVMYTKRLANYNYYCCIGALPKFILTQSLIMIVINSNMLNITWYTWSDGPTTILFKHSTVL